jgi:CHAT domain-containing protein/Tfp pilus assembly protein PilF
MAYRSRHFPELCGRHRHIYYQFRVLVSALFFSVSFVVAPRLQALGDTFSPGQRPAERSRAAGEGEEASTLEPGKPIIRNLTGGQRHVYRIKLDVGQLLKGAVEQRGIDVVVRVAGPDGNQLLEFDAESRSQGLESISLEAEATGEYRLIVQPAQEKADAGDYEIRIQELCAATENDRALYEARRLYEESRKLRRASNYDGALRLVERALEIRERVLGPDHPEVAAAINGLGVLYRQKGEYPKSEQLTRQALEMREKALGPDHPLVADSLNNLAILHSELGDYAKAEALFRRALAVREKALGPEHLDVAQCLNNLGILYRNKGEYAKAEPFYQLALAIFEKRLGPEHLDVAQALNSVANLYWNKGDYTEAEPLYRRALAISEKALGPEHPAVAQYLNSLGILYRNKGEYAKAVPFYQLALAIREKTLGLEHPDVAASLSNLAECYYLDTGETDKAEPLYRRALAIWEKTLGPEHSLVGESLNGLADLCYGRGDYEGAEPLYHRALAIWEKALGPEHPNVSATLGNLAKLYAVSGKIAQAITFQSRANAINEHNLALNLATGSERQKLAYLALFSRETNFTLSFHSQVAPNDPQALTMAFTTLLRRKGRGLDAMTDAIATLRRHALPEDQALLDQLAEARSRLAALTLRESATAKPNTYLVRLRPLEKEVEKLEAKLSSRSAEFRIQTQPIEIEGIQAALPADGALVEFALYTPQDLRGRKILPPRYLAYVLPSQGQPRWVDLGEVASIDLAVGNWRSALRDPNRGDVKLLGRAADEKVMQPVRSLLQSGPADTRHLLIVPDGSLNLIPFAALVDEKNQYLVERYDISYLTSGRDLLRLQTSLPSRSAPLILANPAFGKAQIAATRAAQESGNSETDDHKSVRIDPRQISFRPLPGTRSEALALKDILPDASVLMREEATETALKKARAPRILHIATHGFFLSDQEAPPTKAPGLPGDFQSRNSDPRLNIWAAHVENPLLRSGLAFAGANQDKGGDDDGVLTALEVEGLDLWGTKLIVLSACDTGVGEVKNGEGVQGLRRALVLAGSESQVMSLWTVLDEKAEDLILPYYRALRRGEGRSEALRRVQLRMLRSRELRHPFYWAAFIESGEWANLEGRR